MYRHLETGRLNVRYNTTHQFTCHAAYRTGKTQCQLVYSLTKSSALDLEVLRMYTIESVQYSYGVVRVNVKMYNFWLQHSRAMYRVSYIRWLQMSAESGGCNQLSLPLCLLRLICLSIFELSKYYINWLQTVAEQIWRLQPTKSPLCLQ